MNCRTAYFAVIFNIELDHRKTLTHLPSIVGSFWESAQNTNDLKFTLTRSTVE